MLRIAVCDDDTNAVMANTKITEKCLRRCGAHGEIMPYTDSKSLLADIADDGFYFDLILLDIEMPGSSGMELAEKIRPYLPNVRIIFITSHIEYAVDAFELSIFRYVPKQDIPSGIFSILCATARMRLLRPQAAYRRCVKAYSRCTMNWMRRNLFLSTGAVSSISSTSCR